MPSRAGSIPVRLRYDKTAQIVSLTSRGVLAMARATGAAFAPPSTRRRSPASRARSPATDDPLLAGELVAERRASREELHAKREHDAGVVGIVTARARRR